MTIDKLYFKNLDSIRFIAATMVFLQHGISPSYKYLPIKDTLYEKILYAISNGGSGVSIFFVLSGFLITYLLITEHETNNKISIKNFYIRRILRIWPLYFLIVIFSFFLYPFLKSLIGINSSLGSRFIFHLLFLSNFDVINIQKSCIGNDAMSQNITWSVSVEEQFYLLWPLLFLFSNKKIWGFLILIVIFISILFRLYNYNDSIILYFHSLSVMIDLGIGGLFAYIIKTNSKIRLFFENTNTTMHFIFFSLFLILLIWGNTFFNFKFGIALSRIIFSLSFSLIIVSQALAKKETIFDLGNLSFANKWGKYTYGIYLIHPISITIVDISTRLMDIEKNSFINLFLMGIFAYAITLFLSKASYILFESKLLKLKDKFK